MLTHHLASPLGKRIVVMGAHGFVGQAITKALQTREIGVLPLTKQDINLLEVDSAKKLEKIIKPHDILVLVSAIAPCKTSQHLIKNLQMVQNLCQHLPEGALSQLIYISSDAVYHESESLIQESILAAPSSLHGIMHLARETLLRQALPKTRKVFLRPSLLYGVRDPHNGYGPNRFRRLAEIDHPIVLFGEGEDKRDHVWIEDLARIALLCIYHRSEGVLNVATGQAASFREIAEFIQQQYQSTAGIQPGARQAPISHRHFDISACIKAFPDFKYTTWQDGVVAAQAASQEATA